MIRDGQIVEDGVLDLVPPYWGKPRITSLLVAFLLRLQELEDTLFDVLATRTLETATGVHLEAFGRVVGEPRYDRTDPEYRIAIRGRILANRSPGHLDTIFTIFELVLPDLGVVAREGEAALLLECSQPLDLTQARPLFALLDVARPASVNLQIASPDPDRTPLTLGWGDTNLATPDGLSWTSDPALGGGLSWIIAHV